MTRTKKQTHNGDERAALILELFRQLPDNKFSLRHLASASGGASKEGRRETMQIVEQLLATGVIESCPRDKYRLSPAPVSYTHLVEGAQRPCEPDVVGDDVRRAVGLDAADREDALRQVEGQQSADEFGGGGYGVAQLIAQCGVAPCAVYGEAQFVARSHVFARAESEGCLLYTSRCV